MRRRELRGVPRAVALVAALMLAAVVLTACGDDAFESNDFYAGFLTSQPPAKQLANSSGRGAPGVAELMADKEVRTVTGILQAGETIDKIAQADELQDEATTHFDNGDDDLAAQALEEAITMRPNDPAYRHDRAIVALAQGDIEVAQAQWEAQDQIAKANGWTDDAWYWGQTLAETDAVLTMGMTAGSLASDTGYGVSATYSRASKVYSKAAEHAKAQGDTELAADYEDTADAYQSAADDARYDSE